MSSSRTQHRERRRQRRQDAEQEILDAASRLLRAQRFRELTVDDLMAATTQSRTAFYRFFPDRNALVIRLLYDLAEELWTMSAVWLSGDGDPLVEGRESIERLVDVYQAHGPLLGAIHEAAALDDEVERVYQDLARRFVDATAARIERDARAGRAIPLPDAREAASALVWMSERYLAAVFARPGLAGPEARELAVATLFTIWMRTIYGTDATS
jgi:TetR/AcrR family transcriptional regulator, ethionamide resistance regulator